MHQRRWVVLGLLLGVAVVVVLSDSLHGLAESGLIAAERVIRSHPVWGGMVFTCLAALSAMLAFFSSAIIVPAGVQTWGALTTFFLLWGGWLLGGTAAYSIARFLGRRVVRLFVAPEHLARYEHRLSTTASFGVILLFQLGLPSEVPGYVLGTLRYPFGRYALALTLAELPYALGTVFLGASFVARRVLPFVVVGIAGIGLTMWAFRRLRRSLGLRPSPR